MNPQVLFFCLHSVCLVNGIELEKFEFSGDLEYCDIVTAYFRSAVHVNMQVLLRSVLGNEELFKSD